MRRLSRKVIVRLLLVMILYIVMLRLHVFHKYHILEPFGQSDVHDTFSGNHTFASTRKNSSQLKAGSEVSEGNSSQMGTWNDGDEYIDHTWQVDTEVIFSESDNMILNLDSSKWHKADDNSTNMHEVLTVLNQSHSAYMQCGNDVTRVTLRQPMRKLFGDEDDTVVVGELDFNISDFVVFGVGLDRFDNPRAVSYLFYPPMTAMAWRRLGYGSIVIIVDTLDSWLSRPLHRLVMKLLCNMKAIVIFLPAKPTQTVMISQTSRLFTGIMLSRLLRLQDAPSDYDPYIMTTDADLWAFKHDMFPSAVGADTMPDIFSLNHGCCAWFIHRDHRQKMYPITYVRMRTSIWCKLVKMHTDVTELSAITPDVIARVFRSEFGDLADQAVEKGQNSGWFMDQHLLSFWINQYMRTNGNDRVKFGNREGMRLDRIQWPERVSRVTFDYTFDVHLPKLKAGPSWPRVLTLLKFMYGENSATYKWCVRYERMFVALLPPELFSEQVADHHVVQSNVEHQDSGAVPQADSPVHVVQPEHAEIQPPNMPVIPPEKPTKESL